jgi:hypothetical protein
MNSATCYLVLFFGLTPLPASSGGVIYDPLELAVEYLSSIGMPPPTGSTIRAAESGELGPGQVGYTDPETGDIAIDLEKRGNVASNFEQDPDEFVASVALQLFHEYHHCEGYGESSSGEEGYGNDWCQHMDIYKESLDYFACELIAALAASGASTAGLCALQGVQSGVFNSNLERYQQECDPSASKIWSCPECS